MIGTIEISRLEIYAHHGVMPQERKIGNHFEVWIKLTVDMGDAPQTDNLSKTVNYAHAIAIVKKEMETPSNLIEHVAWRIGTALKQEFPAIVFAKVKVAKTTPPVACVLDEVAVEIEL